MRAVIWSAIALAGSMAVPGLLSAQCPCDPIDEAELLWLRLDYLSWWVKTGPLPTLLTTDPTNGATATAGGLGDPTTQVLIGASGIRFQPSSGFRLEAGSWLTAALGIEAGGFFLGQQQRTYAAGSDGTGSPFLFRPFINPDTGNTNSGGFASLPGFVAGNFQVRATTLLWGGDCHLTLRGPRTSRFALDGLVGFRYLDLQEKLDISDSRSFLAPGGVFNNTAIPPGDRLVLFDTFHTRSQFYGGQVGVRGTAGLGRLVLGADLRLALGTTQQQVNVAGTTTLLPATGGSVTLPGGILAVPSNSGQRSGDDFTLVPELRLDARFDVVSWLQLSVGYDLLYWNRVARPGDQIPTHISATQIPTSPTFTGTGVTPPQALGRTDFWAQGISVGLNLRF